MNKKVVIITIPRGRIKTPTNCVRWVKDLKTANEIFPATRNYEKYEGKDYIKLISPAASNFYKKRNINDSFRTIELKSYL